MDKKLIQKIILAVLAVIFVIFLFRLSGGCKIHNSAEAKSQAVIPKAAAQKQPKAAVSEDDAWGRCPFSGRAYALPTGSPKNIDLKLTGILWEENKASVLINNAIFKEGDAIGSYILVKIKKNSVIVSDGNKEIELKLGQR